MMTSRNHKFFMGKYRSFMTAAAILYGAFAARADYSDENIATTDDSVRRLEVGGKGGSGTVILVFRQTDLGGWWLRG